MELHYGGELTNFPDSTYVGGKIAYIDYVDRNLSTMLNDMVLELGYSEEDISIFRYYFKVPGEDLDFGLRPLNGEIDYNVIMS